MMYKAFTVTSLPSMMYKVFTVSNIHFYDLQVEAQRDGVLEILTLRELPLFVREYKETVRD